MAMSQRVIKFRGRRNDTGKWVYGSLSSDFDGAQTITWWESRLTEAETNLHEPVWCYAEVDPETVGQFTGRKDKNAKEIYEGDILTFDVREWNRASGVPEDKWAHPTWVVRWNEEDAAWDLGGGTASETSTFKEVIGNIYQNRELVQSS